MDILANKVKEILTASQISQNLFLQISPSCRELLVAICSICNEKLIAKSRERMEVDILEELICDYFIKKESSETKEIIPFNKSHYYKDIDTVSREIAEKIVQFPFKYNFIFDTGLKDENFVDLDLAITNDLKISGRNLDNSLFMLHSYRLLSQYSQIKEPILLKGKQLLFTGTMEGYIPYIYLKNKYIERVVDQIVKFIALLEILGYIDFQFYSPLYFNPLSIHIFGSDNYHNNQALNHELSNCLATMKVNPRLFKSFTSLLGVSEDTNTVLKNITNNLARIIRYFRATDEVTGNANENKLNLALKWYISGISAQDQGIGIVNLCICIESLLGSKNQTTSKEVEISERVALYIGNSYKERDDIHLEMKKVQSLRNKIVHNGYILQRDDSNTYYLAIQYVKRILKKEFDWYLASTI